MSFLTTGAIIPEISGARLARIGRQVLNRGRGRPGCVPAVCPPLLPDFALCYTDRGMTSETDSATWRNRWEGRLAVWGERLRAWGLEGLVTSLLEAAEPLSPLGAQALYVAQPALGVFLPADSVGRWARALEDPATLAWLRAGLTATPPDEEGPSDGPAD